MNPLDIQKCWAARDMVPTHGVSFAAHFLAEQAIPLHLALDFLTSRDHGLCLRYLLLAGKDAAYERRDEESSQSRV